MSYLIQQVRQEEQKKYHKKAPSERKPPHQQSLNFPTYNSQQIFQNNDHFNKPPKPRSAQPPTQHYQPQHNYKPPQQHQDKRQPTATTNNTFQNNQRRPAKNYDQNQYQSHFKQNNGYRGRGNQVAREYQGRNRRGSSNEFYVNRGTGRGRGSMNERMGNRPPYNGNKKDAPKRVYQQKNYRKKPQYKQVQKQQSEQKEESVEEEFEEQNQEDFEEGSDGQGEYDEQIEEQEEENEQGNQGDYEEDDLIYSDANEEDEGEEVEAVDRVQINYKINDSQMKAIDQMCGKQEFEDRLHTFDQNNKDTSQRLRFDTSRSFSIFEINKKTNKPDIRLTLKRFRRSADREEENDDENMNVRRSVAGLWKAMSHVNNEIIDSDKKNAKDLVFPINEGQRPIQFIQIYDFLWDRMREMIKDITRLDQEEKMERNVIEICEQMARFFILAVNEGKKNFQSKLEFDEKMNKESLIKILTPLLQIYISARSKLKGLIFQMKNKNEDVTVEDIKKEMEKRDIYISKNQPQMTCYALLINQDYRKSLYENICAGFDDMTANPLFQSQQIQKGLEIQNSLRMNNYEKFFSILQSKQTDYILSSLMLYHVNSVRTSAIKKIFQTFKFSENIEKKPTWGILSSELRKTLRFKQKQTKEYKLFLRNNGTNEGVGSDYIIPGQQRSEIDLYKTPEYFFDKNKRERKMYTKEPAQVSRPVENMEEEITREEVMKRSWHHSSYVDQVISSFLGEEFKEQVIERLLSQDEEQKNKKTEEQERKKKQESENKIKQMREKIFGAKKRKQFLATLEEKLVSVFKKQKQKEKTLAVLFKTLTNKVRNSQIHFFNCLQDNVLRQNQQQYTLLLLNQYTRQRKSFKNILNFDSYEFNKKDKVGDRRSMSQLLGRTVQRKTKNDRFIRDFLQKSLMDLQKTKFLKPFKIKIFFSNKMFHDEQYYTIVKKILENLLGLDDVDELSEHKKYKLDENSDLLEVQLHQLSKETYKNALGASCILLIGVQGTFQRQIKDFIDFFVNLKKIVNEQFSIPLGFFRFLLPSDDFLHEQLPVDYQDTAFLRSSLVALNSSTKETLKKFLQFSINSLYSIEHPQIEGVPLSSIMLEMEENLNYLKKRMKNEEETFIFYQEFINMCFEKLLTLHRNYFKSFQMFQNWFQILNFMSEEDERMEENSHNLKYKMKNQYQYNQSLLKNLNFAIPQIVYSEKNAYTHEDLSNFVMKELMKFDAYAEANSLVISEKLKKLSILDGRIYGDSVDFFKEFLYVIGQNIQYYVVIVPKDFMFQIDFDELLNKVKEKKRYKAKRIESRCRIKPEKNYNLENKPKRLNSGFLYEREQWLNKCLKKVKQFE